MTHRVAIVSAVRTPIGRAGKSYAGVHPVDLLAASLKGAVRGLPDPAAVDQALVGCVYQVGDQSANVGRNAWLAAGLPVTTPASTVDTQCGSSQQAVNLAASLVMAGQADLVVAAGVESLGRVTPDLSREGGDPYPPSLRSRHGMPHQAVAGEAFARAYGISRAESDAFGLRSHLRAHAAWENGIFDDHVVTVDGADGPLLTRDEGIRGDSTAEKLAGLKPAFDADGVITAGSASQLSDGSAAVLLASERAVAEHGLTPLAWVRRVVSVGTDPDLMLEGPIVATRRLLDAEGLTIGDFTLVEVHEAFAPVVCAWQHTYRAEEDRLNPHGGAISMGHPFGASGVRQLADLAHGLKTRAGLGLSVMCCAGGIGTGTVLEAA
ncbi:acetyl-CoA C-acetyltransferase/acetyl-CoA acyltransferase [Amycolatopsis sacchari]|uniref:Acetyl-CoA C-acetyltransferase/acetyl-CoA acyltransferase n=1 Tax=Amycolatopsis sacchari TaxID=115433 RepID=A0A1I3RF33_9PSEU|nr:thiolase family protein [Amycolatopsis sacchari]SFJ43796.1 acetyl-CoA C-acetyltransferase/acetyl-CoA acyltransferase [Amycolatopsis sacchari]